MTAKKETENLKTTRKRQTASSKPSASSGGKKTTSRANTAGKNAKKGKQQKKTGILSHPVAAEILIWFTLALCIILFISNFGIGGFVGNAISSFLFGMFGFVAYLFPVILFLLAAFLISNRENVLAWMKAAAVILMLFCVCSLVELIVNQYDVTREFLDFYEASAKTKSGGGLAGGVICTLVCPAFGMVGAYVLVIVLMIICMVLITEKSLFQNVRKTSRRVYEDAREDAALRREQAAIREERQRIIRSEQRKIKRERLEEEKKNLEKIPEELRRQRKVRGVVLDNELHPRASELEEVHEIIPPVPKRKPDIPKGSLKVMDFDIQGEDFTVPTDQREPKESPELPFTSERMPEPDIWEREEFEERPRIREQRPSMFEEQLRVNGELSRDSYNSPLREPLFLQKAEPEDPFLLPEDEEEEVPVMQDRGKGSGEFHTTRNEQEAWDTPKPQDDWNFIEEEPLLPSDNVRGRADFGIPEKRNEPENRKTSDIPEGASPEKHVRNPKSSKEEQAKAQESVAQEIQMNEEEPVKEYVFPPMDLLSKPSKGRSGVSEKELRETAMKLQQIFDNFGVGVHVTNASCGPTVTRYELTPEQGVKVSRIVGLADDIKLNLAAADIRIEAPIPGKAAVGIEVPNKTNGSVPIRELLETREFQEHPSNLAFAAGKDIGGNVIVADIAKMPHLLIAGATGSGKSVCINTIIMSLLYKSKPEDVKLIMIDPKVVELSVYNGIPHLLIPVVTDPKKASGALNWAVAEMTDRYQKFAEYNVRDLKGYNKKVEAIRDIPDENKPKKMPQIVIIVDELADLMMVAPGEVEDAICRLAQLARAAGLHLIIATQRPSVNVITGIIKANMPSRIAFAVSSGVDSRTIIDMVGAEKLLGKGDMLFYPQGYQKPARVQGSFVSDSEVSAVVDFLTRENSIGEYSADIEEKITQAQKAVPGGSSEESGVDEYFEKAGRFIIEKDKASIGMLQRVLKIGFNRAARIMDQLADAGVVGPEEGTKPRKILMSMEQFEDYLSDYV